MTWRLADPACKQDGGGWLQRAF